MSEPYRVLLLPLSWGVQAISHGLDTDRDQSWAFPIAIRAKQMDKHQQGWAGQDLLQGGLAWTRLKFLKPYRPWAPLSAFSLG